MRIYVASGYPNRINARKLMDELEGRGHVITLDWTSHEWVECSENALQAIRIAHSTRDEDGVLTADMLVLLHPAGNGSHTEFGMALGSNKVIAIIGKPKGECIFYHSKRIDYRFDTVEEFLEFMDNVERKSRLDYKVKE